MAILPDLLRMRAESTPAMAAVVVDGSSSLSFERWERRSNAFARGLARRGVRPGDPVLLVFDNSHLTDYAVAYVGVHKAAAVAVPVSSRIAAPALEGILRQCGAAAVIRPLDLGPCLQAPPLWGRAWHADPATLEADHSIEEFQVPLAPGDRAEILYTSGTVGTRKGVSCSHEDITLDARPPVAERCPRAATLFLHAFPPGTNAAQEGIRLPLRHGDKCGVVLPSFEPERFCQVICERGISRLQLVPALAQVILESGAPARYDVTSIERVVLTGAPAPPALLAKLADAFPRAAIWNSYTLTEAAQARTIMRYDGTRAGSVGRPDAGTEVRVADAVGVDLPPGQTGEIWLRRAGGPQRHYHDDPEATSAAFVDGWLRTGDLGYLDTDGYLYLVDRKDDVIVSGGSKISCIEVEAVLAEHPAVVEAAVFSLPHGVLGHAVAAAAAVRSHVEVASLRSFVRRRLGDIEAPQQILLVERLPRNQSGKVLKDDLRRAMLNAPAPVPIGLAEGATQIAIRSMWQEVLGVEQVGPDDDFFDQGGHSLAASRVLSRIEEQLGVRLAVTAIFDCPTVAALSAAVDRARRG
ncbi:MAG TPA: non-ribosomal peptide synthetase [Acidimicrobiales bacterium]|nr:non-ribosomal peptide synthetase [Acidimicrobiales bacterium]